MPERDMTPDERERFEREQVHHDNVQDSAGPGSEADSEARSEPTIAPVVVGNPD